MFSGLSWPTLDKPFWLDVGNISLSQADVDSNYVQFKEGICNIFTCFLNQLKLDYFVRRIIVRFVWNMVAAEHANQPCVFILDLQIRNRIRCAVASLTALWPQPQQVAPPTVDHWVSHGASTPSLAMSLTGSASPKHRTMKCELSPPPPPHPQLLLGEIVPPRDLQKLRHHAFRFSNVPQLCNCRVCVEL